MLELLKESDSSHVFEFQYYSPEFITEVRKTASHKVIAKKGAEIDRE